jgi:APA family basic amino acid/polyamine antiporter
MKEVLTKKYGIVTTGAMVVGIMIGIGVYFRTGSLITITQGNTILGLYAWVFGAVITALAGLCFAELSSNFTASGGDITYMQNTAGDIPAFMLGWGGTILGRPALAAIFAWVGAGFLTGALSLDSKIFQLPIALAFVIITFLLNMFKPKGSGKYQVVMTIIKIVPLALLILFGLFRSGGQISQISKPVVLTAGSNPILIFFAALIPVVFTFDGYINAAIVSQEIENPQKNLPKALLGGIAFVAVIYILLYLSFVNVFPADKLAKAVPFGIAQQLFGGVGGQLIMIGITISALGALNGISLASIRAPYSLGVRKMIVFSEKFEKVDEKTNSPLISGFTMLCLTIGYVLCNYFLGDNGDFSGIISVMNFIFYIIIYAGLIKLRYQGKLRKDGFRTPLFPLIPILAILTSLTLAIGLFFINPDTTRNTLISLGVYFIGIPLYFVEKSRVKKATQKNNTKNAQINNA